MKKTLKRLVLFLVVLCFPGLLFAFSLNAYVRTNTLSIVGDIESALHLADQNIVSNSGNNITFTVGL